MQYIFKSELDEGLVLEMSHVLAVPRALYTTNDNLDENTTSLNYNSLFINPEVITRNKEYFLKVGFMIAPVKIIDGVLHYPLISQNDRIGNHIWFSNLTTQDLTHPSISDSLHTLGEELIESTFIVTNADTIGEEVLRTNYLLDPGYLGDMGVEEDQLITPYITIYHSDVELELNGEPVRWANMEEFKTNKDIHTLDIIADAFTKVLGLV